MTMQAMTAPMAWQIPLMFPGWQLAPRQALYCGKTLTKPDILPIEEERRPIDPAGMRRLMYGVMVQARRDASHQACLGETQAQAEQIREEARSWLMAEDGGKLYGELLGLDTRLIERQAAAGWPQPVERHWGKGSRIKTRY